MVHLPSAAMNGIHCDIDPAAGAALAAFVRGNARDWVVTDALIDEAIVHGMDSLLAHSSAGDAPPAAAVRLKGLLAGHQALAAARDEELSRVLERLAKAGIATLVFKGAHLAHALYDAPGLRPRADTDLLILDNDLPRVAPILASAGYDRLRHVRGSIILGQWHFHRTDSARIVHTFDVHWRVAAPLLLRDMLPTPSVQATSVPIRTLGPYASGPSSADALLISCVHVAAHHRRGAMLLWLFDIARLADACGADDRAAFLRRVDQGQVSGLCLAALEAARRYFDSPAVESLSSAIRAATPATPEPATRLLSADRRIHELWLDLRAMPTWNNRAAVLREHLWPDAEYIRATQPGARSLMLAYLRRVARGLPKWTAVSGGHPRTAGSAVRNADSAEDCGFPRGSGTTP